MGEMRSNMEPELDRPCSAKNALTGEGLTTAANGFLSSSSSVLTQDGLRTAKTLVRARTQKLERWRTWNEYWSSIKIQDHDRRLTKSWGQPGTTWSPMHMVK
jgi:hypothetical protein